MYHADDLGGHMNDTEISKITTIPYRTIQEWKKAPLSDWRAKIYTLFSLKTVEEVKPEIERIEKILKMREEGKK